MALIAGCGAASSPQNVAGVRAMYRYIGIDASAGSFSEICESYMDERLRNKLEPLTKDCTTSRFEHWAEKVRLSKIRPGTRIVISGREALVYDGVKPEKVSYIAGQWRLAEVPEMITPR
jgi:hypothetical protein